MNADRNRTATTCATLFSAIQYQKPEEQLLGLATSFLLLSTAIGVPAQDVFEAAKNVMRDPSNATGTYRTFDAMSFHLKTHVLAGNGGIV